MVFTHAHLREAVVGNLVDPRRQGIPKEETATRVDWKIQLILTLVLLIVPGLNGNRVWAHCDTESGPVAIDARQALENGQLERAAIWVSPEQHEELRAAFEQALAVNRMGGKAKELAERYFTETAVRLHRQAEGLPYTGLKPAEPLPPDVEVAERALETGDLQAVSALLTSEIQERLQHLFVTERAARRSKDESLTAGREWVDAYVRYVTYVHGLHETIQAGPSHGVGE